MISVCPTDVVEAPIDRVWGLLTAPADWGRFYDVSIDRVVPPGPATEGQVVHGRSGPGFLALEVRFRFVRVDGANHRLGVEIQLPFGIAVDEELSCRALGPGRCRVNYHCAFRLPPGWRGLIVRTLFRRALARGPVDSLSRLKKAAEQTSVIGRCGTFPIRSTEDRRQGDSLAAGPVSGGISEAP